MNECPLITFCNESGKQSLYPDGDMDCHRNLIICSLAHCQPSLKISRKSIWKFLRKVANRQKNTQTNKQQRKHNLLGRVITRLLVVSDIAIFVLKRDTKLQLTN